jgi:hypothetical protein
MPTAFNPRGWKKYKGDGIHASTLVVCNYGNFIGLHPLLWYAG